MIIHGPLDSVTGYACSGSALTLFSEIKLLQGGAASTAIPLAQHRPTTIHHRKTHFPLIADSCNILKKRAEYSEPHSGMPERIAD